MKTIDEEELRGYDDTPNKEGLQCIFNVDWILTANYNLKIKAYEKFRWHMEDVV